MSSLIEDYLRYTSIDKRSERFHLFACIAGISACMERRLWLQTSMGTLSPNVYVLLTGPAGSGKTTAIKRVESFLKRINYSYEAPRLKFSPTKITPAALIEVFGDAYREYTIGNDVIPQCPVFASIHELSDLFTDIGGGDMMKQLLTYYDPPGFLTAKEFEVAKRTRMHSNEILVNPSLTVLAGTTTDYLATSVAGTEGRQGLASRIIFCVDNTFYDDTPETVKYDELLAARISDKFSRVMRTKGDMKFSADAEKLWIKVVDDNNALRRRYHKSNTLYEQYYNRRLTQVQKLSMISSVSRGIDRVVTDQDISNALAWLAIIEPDIPMAFGMRAIHKDPMVAEILLSFMPSYPASVSEQGLMQILRDNGMTMNLDSQVKGAIDYLRMSGEIDIVGDRSGFVTYQRKAKR